MAVTIVVKTGENFIAARVAGDLRAGRPDLVWRRRQRATLAMEPAIGPLILVCLAFPTQFLGSAIVAASQVTKIISGPIWGLKGAAIAQAVSGAFRNGAGFTAASLLIPIVAPATDS